MSERIEWVDRVVSRQIDLFQAPPEAGKQAYDCVVDTLYLQGINPVAQLVRIKDAVPRRTLGQRRISGVYMYPRRDEGVVQLAEIVAGVAVASYAIGFDAAREMGQ